MSTPEPEPGAFEPPQRRIKMRAGYDGDESRVSVSGRAAGAPPAGFLSLAFCPFCFPARGPKPNSGQVPCKGALS